MNSLDPEIFFCGGCRQRIKPDDMRVCFQGQFYHPSCCITFCEESMKPKKPQNLLETSSAVWKLEGILEEWFREHYPEAGVNSKNKVIENTLDFLLYRCLRLNRE